MEPIIAKIDQVVANIAERDDLAFVLERRDSGIVFARSQYDIWEPYLRRSRYRFLVLVDGPGAVPQEVQERLAAFIEKHHVERPFVKRKRDRADPEVMATRRPK